MNAPRSETPVSHSLLKSSLFPCLAPIPSFQRSSPLATPLPLSLVAVYNSSTLLLPRLGCRRVEELQKGGREEGGRSNQRTTPLLGSLFLAPDAWKTSMHSLGGLIYLRTNPRLTLAIWKARSGLNREHIRGIRRILVESSSPWSSGSKSEIREVAVFVPP